LLVPAGAQVVRGQAIAKVGTTGNSTGNHDHHYIRIDEVVGGVLRNNYYDPGLFYPAGTYRNGWYPGASGALVNDPRILPIGAVAPAQNVQLNAGAICNIRTAPNLLLSSIYATARADGIYRLGVKIAEHGATMKFGGYETGAGYTWALCYLNGGYRRIAKQFVHFV
jgi:hypothetical protein